MKVVPLRLQPGTDLRRALGVWMGEQEEKAGCLISAVGSLSVAQLRLAGAKGANVICGDLEILSLCGNLSHDGAHLHIAVANTAIGGDKPGAARRIQSILAGMQTVNHDSKELLKKV
jgi:uncharacterized protein